MPKDSKSPDTINSDAINSGPTASPDQKTLTSQWLADGQSPCVGVCAIDPQQRCVGCGRTLQQIGQWSTMSIEQRQRINDNLPKKVRERLLGGDDPRATRAKI